MPKKPAYKPKTCPDCNAVFAPTGGNQARCPACQTKWRSKRHLLAKSKKATWLRRQGEPHKERERKRRQTPEYKEKHREHCRKYAQSPDGRETRRNYRLYGKEE